MRDAVMTDSPISKRSELDRVMANDRRFFARRPQRQWRLRRAHRVEVSELARMGEPVELPDSMAWFTVVAPLYEGARARRFYRLPRAIDTDQSDAEIATLLAQF
jgi:hypothetical protein